MMSYSWKNEIEHALNDDIVGITELPGGLTNTNFLVTLAIGHRVVVRVPAPHNETLFNYGNEYCILEQVQPLRIDVELLYFNPHTGIKCTRFVPDVTTLANPNNWSAHHLIRLAHHLQQLHAIPLLNIQPFNPINKYAQYKNEITTLLHHFPEQNIIDSIKQLYEKYEEVLCHNDLVPGNILVNSTHLYLIDYEYAAGNIPLFDLVSFINENNRSYDDHEVRIFLEAYLKRPLTLADRKELLLMDHFQCLLWHHWANRLYDITHEVIYKDIADLKYQRYLNLK